MERVPKRIKLILLKKKGSGIFCQTLLVSYLTYSRNIKTECPRSRIETTVPFLYTIIPYSINIVLLRGTCFEHVSGTFSCSESCAIFILQGLSQILSPVFLSKTMKLKLTKWLNSIDLYSEIH